MNRMDFITSKEMYDQALKLFQVEIRKAGRGHLVFVVDENGNPIRHPVKMSDFQERPKFYLPEQNTLSQHFENHHQSDLTGQSSGVLKSLVLKELIRQAKTQLDDGLGFRNKKYKLKSQKNRVRRKL